MVRLMKTGDLEQVVNIEERCFPESWSGKMIESGLKCSYDIFFVIEMKQNLIGYAALRILGGVGEIQRIAILPEWRRQGYARELLDSVVKVSRQKQAGWMILEVRNSNETARNLYKSYGFFEEGIRKDYYRNPSEDAILMRLNLV